MKRFSNRAIIDAYRETGSVWEAGKLLGIAGQTVHKRLTALGYPMVTRKWTAAETEELRALVGHLPISQIADQLGRPYAGVACKISELGIGTGTGSFRRRKIPRGAGYDKVSVKKYAKQIDAAEWTVHRFARGNGLNVETLCGAFERHLPDWWQQYRESHSDLPEAACLYCQQAFIPNNGKQRFCTRRCSNLARTDANYFGGKRRNTIGLAEGICQLCGSTGKSLSSHHIYGKENDQENEFLVALCQGCHQAVTILALRPYLETPAGWEALIQLCHLRRHGHERPAGVFACVEIEAVDEAGVQEHFEIFGEDWANPGAQPGVVFSVEEVEDE